MVMKRAAVLVAAVMFGACTYEELRMYGSFERGLTDPLSLEPGQIVIKPYKVLLSASSNSRNVDGISKRATLTVVGPTGCASGFDAGCPDGGTASVASAALLDGTTETKLFERCAFGSECQQTVQVRVRLHDDQTSAVTVGIVLRAEVLNAGYDGTGLTIVPE